MSLDKNVNIGISDADKKNSIKLLNDLLSNQFVLLAKTWNFHWNVKGIGFKAAHLFMEELYNDLIQHIDDTAERIRALGGRPLGSLSGYLSHNSIKEYDDHKELPNQQEMLAILAEDNEYLIREMRALLQKEDNINDGGTANLIEDLIEQKEKQVWMIRSHMG